MKRLIEILLLSAAVTSLMGADEGNARYERLGSKIMCTCGCDQMLLKCNHVGCPNSDRMIRELHALTGTGPSGSTTPGQSSPQLASIQPEVDDQAVLNWFRRTWGVTAVVEPGTHGLELWAWIMPPVALGLGFVLVVVTLRKWRPRRLQASPQQVLLDPHLEALRNRARRETEI
jgi:cytochrome c-type biogenesis protein CcmH